MLPPFIIEQIRRREEQERSRHEQGQYEEHSSPPEAIGNQTDYVGSHEVADQRDGYQDTNCHRCEARVCEGYA